MGFLEGSQMVSNAINTRAKVKEMRAADKFNDSMTAAKDAHAQGIKDLEASGVSGSELEARRSALDTARWEAERDAYVQRYGDADKYINHQKSIQEANKTSRDNMVLEAQRKAFAHQQNQIQANQFLRNIGELSDDDKTKSMQFINNYYSDMMDGGTIGYANGAFSVTDKAGNVRALSAQEAQGFATRLMEDRSNLENLFTLTGIAQGSMDEYHKDQKALSDRATEAVTRGKTKAEAHKLTNQGNYYGQKAKQVGLGNNVAATGGAINYEQDEQGNVTGAVDDNGIRANPDASEEEHGERAQMLVNGLQNVASSLLKGKGDYTATPIGFNPSTGKYIGEIKFGGKTYRGTPEELKAGLTKLLAGGSAINDKPSKSSSKPTSNKKEGSKSKKAEGSGINLARGIDSLLTQRGEDARREAAIALKLGTAEYDASH